MNNPEALPEPRAGRGGRPLLGRAHRGAGEDADLLRRIRAGQDVAFGELFAQHADAVRRFALGLTTDRTEADDLTAETFFRVLQALRRGSGPDEHIRGYLLTVARRVAWEWWAQRRDVPVSDDELSKRIGSGGDTHGRSAEHNLITRAFTSLPERWRKVLWQVEVEGERPAVVAPAFGLSANATAALARRARRGLRAAYLQAHLAVHRSAHDCRSTMEKLGAYTAGTLRGTEKRRVSAHLAICADCRSTQDELRDVCFSLRAHAAMLLPAVGGGALAAQQLGGSAASATATAGSLGPGSVGASGAAGAGVAGAGSAGFGMGVKGVLLGVRAKAALAVASSAGVGVFGVAVAPVLEDADTVGALPYSGAPSQQLRLETSSGAEGPSPFRELIPPTSVPDVARSERGQGLGADRGAGPSDPGPRGGSGGAAGQRSSAPGAGAGGGIDVDVRGLHGPRLGRTRSPDALPDTAGDGDDSGDGRVDIPDSPRESASSLASTTGPPGFPWPIGPDWWPSATTLPPGTTSSPAGSGSPDTSGPGNTPPESSQPGGSHPGVSRPETSTPAGPGTSTEPGTSTGSGAGTPPDKSTGQAPGGDAGASRSDCVTWAPDPVWYPGGGSRSGTVVVCTVR